MVTGAFPKYALERQTPVLSTTETVDALVAEYRQLWRALDTLHHKTAVDEGDILVVQAQLRQIAADIVAAGGRVPHALQSHSLMENS